MKNIYLRMAEYRGLFIVEDIYIKMKEGKCGITFYSNSIGDGMMGDNRFVAKFEQEQTTLE